MQPNPNTPRDVWRHYVVTKTLPERVLREPIYQAWRRCDLAGASPIVMNAQELPPLRAKALFEERRDLIEASRPYLHALSQAAGSERHAAMLGDEKAIVLDVVGDEESVHGRQRVPGPGALLAESHAGANGIGTPLAEGGYIELVGPEHFIEGFHPFTCQGIPINGPDGKTTGVLSTSVRRAEVSERMREILYCAARGIEAELMRRRLMADVEQLVLTSGNDAKLLEALEQDIIQLQGAARLRLEKAVRLAATDRQDDAVRLLTAATALMQRFQRQSQLWREIASSDVGALQYVNLSAHLDEVTALLATEFSIRGLEVQSIDTAQVIVFADPQDLRRQIFRAFQQAFQDSPQGSTLQVETMADEAAGVAFVHFGRSSGIAVVVPLHPAALERAPFNLAEQLR